MSESHGLAVILTSAADGVFPAVDGDFEILPPDDAGTVAIVEFTGHAVVLAECGRDDLCELGADGFGGASHPAVKLYLAGDGGAIGSHDAVLVARGTGPVHDLDPVPRRDGLDEHPRVQRARDHRRDVSVYGDNDGFVTIGRGLVGRTEMSVELLDASTASNGNGRRLIRRGLALVDPGAAVWAQVAPGNAASLRAFLACGFTPICAETLIDLAR